MAIMDNFSDDSDYMGFLLHKKCPACGAALLGNSVGDKWCSRIDCAYIDFQPDPEPIIKHSPETDR